MDRKKRRLSESSSMNLLSPSKGSPEPDSEYEVDESDDDAERDRSRKQKAGAGSKKKNGPGALPLVLSPEKKGKNAGANDSKPLAGSLQLANKPIKKDAKDTTELTDLYTQCIELATANKITTKNTWQLELIDYIDDVIQGDGGDDATMNFQRASCTLEASVKIYSCRVDSVHSETYKMLGGLNRTDGGKSKEGGDNDGDGEGDADGEVEGATKKRATTSRRGQSTLEQKPGALNMKKLDLECQVDPLFQKTSAAFDEGGAKGLLMNRLGVSKGCAIVFDSTEPAFGWQDADDKDQSVVISGKVKNESENDDDVDAYSGKKIVSKKQNNITLTNTVASMQLGVNLDLSDLWKTLKATTKGVDLNTLQLCPAMEEFRRVRKSVIDEVDPETLADSNNPSTSSSSSSVSASASASSSSFAASLPQNFAEMHDTPQFDESQLDLDMGGDDGDDDGGSGMAFAGVDAEGLDKAIAQEEKLLHLIESEDPDMLADLQESGAVEKPIKKHTSSGTSKIGDVSNEFAFLDAKIMKSWAGATHWKFRNTAAKATGDGSKAAKRKKKVFTVDFSSSAPAVDRSLFAKPSRASCSISQATLAKSALDVAKYVLPDDMHYKVPRLQTLFTKPNVLLRLQVTNAGVADQGAGRNAALFNNAQGGKQASKKRQSDDALPEAGEATAQEVASNLQFQDEGALDGHDNDGPDLSFDNGGSGDNGDEPDVDAEGNIIAPESGSGTTAFSLGDDGKGWGMGIDMVSEAKKTEKIDINYAKFAKKVDVRVLKNTIWQEVSVSAPSSIKTEKKDERKHSRDDDDDDFKPKKEDALVVKGDALSFKGTIASLHGRLPADAMKSVSIPYCFICLLHLANEKDLQFVAKQAVGQSKDTINKGVVDAGYNLCDFDIVRKV